MKTTLAGQEPGHAALLRSARSLSTRFPLWLCDVWGVVHDGTMPCQPACEALSAHRSNGGTVILITNAPRPHGAVIERLDQIGVAADCYDAVVSSGDITAGLTAFKPDAKVFHLGPKVKDDQLLASIAVTFTSPDDAELILCTGLVDDHNEAPEDYDDLLAPLAERALVMVCANPDLVVRFGNRLLPCAGALAERYETLGGTVHRAGKPFTPIYDEAFRLAERAAGRLFSKAEALAIGDGLPTDVLGAAGQSMEILFIVNGIHEVEFKQGGPEAISRRIAETAEQAKLAGIMMMLAW